MKHKRIWQRLTSTHWAIMHDALDEIMSIAQRQNLSPEAVAAALGRDLDNTYDAQVREGVAILPVKGPLFRYANVFTAISGASSYEMLALDLQRVVEDDSVKAILLDVDSPGGEVNGDIELAEMIHAARARKPVWAYVGGTGASAAYVLASAATKVVVAENAMIGSVGTVVSVIDRSGADEKAGVKRYEFVSSQSPHKRVDPGTKEGASRIQSLVDAHSDVLVDKIAMFRDVGRDDVLSDFGQGDVMLGAAAVAAGMVDAVGSFEAVLADLVATGQDRTNSRFLGSGAAGARSEEEAMSEKSNATAGGKAGMTDAELMAKSKSEGEEKDREDDEAKGKSKAKGKAAEGDEDEEEDEEAPAGKKAKSKSKSKAKGKGKAADDDDEEVDADDDDEEEDSAKSSAERVRIRSILTSAEAKGRAELAQHLAFDTDMTVEAAAALLAKSPKAQGDEVPGFMQAMDRAGNPDVGAGADGGGGDETSKAVKSIVSAAQAAGDSRY